MEHARKESWKLYATQEVQRELHVCVIFKNCVADQTVRLIHLKNRKWPYIFYFDRSLMIPA